MYNWSTDETKLKQNPEEYTIWKLEQLINFGLGDEKIKKAELEKFWNKLNIDSARRLFLSYLLFSNVSINSQ